MSLRYKEGDRVVLGDADALREIGVPTKYRHCIGTITKVSAYDEVEPYKTEFEDGEYWWTSDNCIDHEATADLRQTELFDINKEFEKIAAEILTNNIEEMQNSNPTIKQSWIPDSISKGGETMNANEILEKWHSKRYVELRNKAEDEKQKVTKQDEIQKLFEEHEATIQKTIKEKYKVDVEVEHTFFAITTSKSSKKLAEIEDKCKAEERELDEKIKEIKAVLEVAENQDKVFEILNKQGIIDKNYNIL